VDVSLALSQNAYQHSAIMLKVEIPKHLQTAEWARMPKPGQRENGLTRTTLLEIIQDPQSGVKSAVIRKPGRTRGIRLIYLPSLYAYLSRLAGMEEELPEPSKEVMSFR
jgi:hypothetical protein